MLIPYYPGTAQELAFELVAKKVTASLQVDGLDVRAALEAAGAGDGLPDGLDAALSLGKAMYRALARAAFAIGRRFEARGGAEGVVP